LYENYLGSSPSFYKKAPPICSKWSGSYRNSGWNRDKVWNNRISTWKYRQYLRNRAI